MLLVMLYLVFEVHQLWVRILVAWF